MKSSYRKLTVLWRVLRSIVPPDICNLNPLIKEYETFLYSLLEDHGPRIAVKVLKGVANDGKRLSLRLPLVTQEYPFWLQTDKFGFPKRLPRLSRLLRSRTMLKKIGLTILNSYLSIRVKPKPDYSKIIGRYQGQRPYRDGGKDFLRFLDWYLERFRKNVSLRRPKDLFLTKTGPYGKPMIHECVESAAFLESTFGKDLRDSILELFEELGGDADDLRQRLLYLSSLHKGKPPFYGSKVTPIPDRGGKTRHVASSIYWAQVVLYPIHEFFMNLLRKFPEDFTYDQERSIDVVQKWMREGRKVHSIDLSDATDRFPFKIQYEIVKRILGKKIADLWKFIILDPPLTSSGRIIDYRVGQPMGKYSSFPIFAFSHHCVVKYCGWVVSKSNFYLYLLLGDDINIANSRVARVYRHFLKRVGVKVSPTKTLVSRKGNLVSEFAKQIIWNGKLLTPLTPDRLIVMSEGYYTLVVELCTFLSVRWRFKTTHQLRPPSVVKHLDRKTRRLARRDLSNPMCSHLWIDSPGVRQWCDQFWLGEYGPDSQRSYRLCLEGAMRLRLKLILKETEELLERYITPLREVLGMSDVDWLDLIWDKEEELLFEKFKKLGSIFHHPIARFAARLGWKSYHMLNKPGRLYNETEIAALYVELIWLNKLLENTYIFQDKHLEMHKIIGKTRRAAAAAFRGETKALLQPYYDL